ncbi:flagellar biosynthetic protein FlhB [Novosphingobium chloroacetimidivorans]|uniref:Flagellar biosynthetic protein FlhB n=1 Tax=Novosphingobium chloroacetimidivorans TaxID=1428314 RepID=A0A7W7K8A6_9SPHN|nr:flagellar type III secretion system protein FlhB [Novosphingobium chloroacetimidivorans]MBB4858087.1 flagellar biosynthetic protein FlhB [Novosphingobium chloroacetimidivorans]
MSEDSGEKTFAPSAKRLRDAAKKGDVLRSRELATAGATLVAAAWLLIAGPWVLGLLAETLRTSFTWDRTSLENFAPGAMLLQTTLAVLPPIAVLGVAVIIVSLASQLGFGGEGRWLGSNLAPKGSRLNPMSGLKRMFGANGWIEMVKGLAKVALLGTMAWTWGRNNVPQLSRLGRGDVFEQLAYGWHQIVMLLFVLAGGLVLIAFIDFPVQWFRRHQRLKMSMQEMRDEHKEAEGAPEKKQAQRERQRKIAMGGLIPAVKDAQFILTNPTHFSVALAYDPEKAGAPIVLAKGRGDKALAMRELAAEYQVPVLEYPALARSVYYTTRERQVIREELYVAIAAILAFVFALKRGEHPPRPDVNVPLTLRFDTEGRLDPSIVA